MLHALDKLLPALQILAQKDFLVVTSIGKSGSTWVQKLLDAHEEIYCGGEGKYQEFLDQVVPAIERFNSALGNANELIYGESPYYVPWRGFHQTSQIQFAIALSLATASRPVPPSVRYVGDKDTGYVFNILAWKTAVLPGAKYIHVIRDPRDSFLSNVNHFERQGTVLTPGSGAYHDSLTTWCRAWVKGVEDMRAAFADDPEALFELRYEDLLSAPEAWIRRTLEFLGVDASESAVARCRDAATFTQLSGGREQGEEDRNSFYRKGVAGEWQTRLEAKAKEIVRRETAPLLAMMQYEEG